jgi:8-amino-7-oxononanoate synthase
MSASDLKGENIANPIEQYFSLKLEDRKSKGLFRKASSLKQGIDFISNDYLSIGRMPYPGIPNETPSGSTASRLVCGESDSLLSLEAECSHFFDVASTLYFPNGYMANLALLSTIGRRGDTYIYDAHCHVSLKDGMRLSPAKRFPFRHNDLEDLRKKINNGTGQIFIVVEAIYSMEGDLAPIKDIQQICEVTGALLVVDEAHSTGVLGEGGRGAGYELPKESRPWIQIFTFGKALGASGAAVGAPEVVRQYLLNYAHPAIYSTAVLPAQVEICRYNLNRIKSKPEWVTELQDRIRFWNQAKGQSGFSSNEFSPIQYLKTGGTDIGKRCEEKCKKAGILTKLMLPPTVPAGEERLRICLHRHNNEIEIQSLLALFGDF